MELGNSKTGPAAKMKFPKSDTGGFKSRGSGPMREPFSCNRYLLIGLYTLLATLAYFLYLAMYIVNELQGV